MSTSISLTQTQAFTALAAVLGSFGLVSASGVPIPVIRGQVNRAPEPASQDFVVLWPIFRDRLATNIDNEADNQITGSITNNILTATAVLSGFVPVGLFLWPMGCRIIAQTSGAPGGIGNYTVSITPNIISQTLYCGTDAILQKTEVVIQADVHGPSSADNAARISTLFRDQFGVSAFQDTGLDIAPLYTSDPRQMPFDNAENQVEERWSVDLHMQANVTITTTAQFADRLVATTKAADLIPIA